MKYLISIVFVFICYINLTHAEDEKNGGWIRDRIKKRILKKLEEQPTPESSKDVDTKIQKSGDYTFTFKYGDLDRYYKIHIPINYNSKNQTPLIFSFHGGGGSMSIQSDEQYYHLKSKSDEVGFVAVFPNGYSKFKSGQLATWNAGKCCAKARDENSDDVGFIKEILKHLEKQINVNPNKIFAIGMSNGGMMSYRLACEMSDTFKAIAAVAGTDNTNICNPKNPISILHIHAKNDDHVLFNGGAGKNFTDETKVNNFTSVPDTLKKWINLNGCNEKPKRTLENSQVYCDQYLKCKNSVEVQLCVTETGAHSWPGGSKPRDLNEKPSTAISANDVIWEFFKNK